MKRWNAVSNQSKQTTWPRAASSVSGKITESKTLPKRRCLRVHLRHSSTWQLHVAPANTDVCWKSQNALKRPIRQALSRTKSEDSTKLSLWILKVPVIQFGSSCVSHLRRCYTQRTRWTVPDGCEERCLRWVCHHYCIFAGRHGFSLFLLCILKRFVWSLWHLMMLICDPVCDEKYRKRCSCKLYLPNVSVGELWQFDKSLCGWHCIKTVVTNSRLCRKCNPCFSPRTAGAHKPSNCSSYWRNCNSVEVSRIVETEFRNPPTKTHIESPQILPLFVKVTGRRSGEYLYNRYNFKIFLNPSHVFKS